MKKTILIATMALFVFASCKKNRTCECTTVNGSNTSVENITIKDNKKGAEEACDLLDAKVGALTKSCEIVD